MNNKYKVSLCKHWYIAILLDNILYYGIMYIELKAQRNIQGGTKWFIILQMNVSLADNANQNAHQNAFQKATYTQSMQVNVLVAETVQTYVQQVHVYQWNN